MESCQPGVGDHGRLQCPLHPLITHLKTTILLFKVLFYVVRSKIDGESLSL